MCFAAFLSPFRQPTRCHPFVWEFSCHSLALHAFPATVKHRAPRPTDPAPGRSASAAAEDAAPGSAPESPDRLVVSMCQKVARAWHGSRDRGGAEVPIGVVASLGVLEQPEDGPDVTARLLRFSPQQLIAHYRSVWTLLWLIRPELADWAQPVRSWLEQVALQARLLDVTGSAAPYRRSQVDVFGVLLRELRSLGASQAIGEFHTPPDASDLLARLTLEGEPRPGLWFDDPAAGTGGLLRAAAQRLRGPAAIPVISGGR